MIRDRVANFAKRLLLAVMVLSGGMLFAAREDPVQWSLAPAGGSGVSAPGGTQWLELKATIQEGWHLYSPTTPAGGPIITKLTVSANPAIAEWHVYRPQPVRKLDPNFQIDTETYTGTAVFLIEAKLAPSAAGDVKVEATARYQACSDVKCLNPVRKTATTSIRAQSGAATTAFTLPAGYAAVTQTSAPTGASGQVVAGSAAAGPVTFGSAASSQQDALPFLLAAFGAGILALFTPCVFPMIPITVSFFLNQNAGTPEAGKSGGWRQALVFCAGIIVLFTGLGFLVTAIAGPFGVVQLGSSPWVNGFIAVVFFAFGLSLLGAFELRLPSGVLTRLDRASQGGGYAGTLLMGLTFSLTSFACIGPIVGPLLISSVQSKGFLPVAGMFAFATGLAAPFFFLALFPSYLGKLPRSDGWMSRVKIVLGFVVLAVMLKYISNVDQVLQWRWLTRERFLAAWIVLFGLAGLYLLGLVRMEGIKREDTLGVARALIAALFLIFAISLAPGLFGSRLGDLDAFIPEASASGASAANGTAESVRLKNDLDGALAAAREQHKLVLVDFTGYACTNCHWMNANMFPRPEIQAALKSVIIVDLYTDGTDAASEKNQQLEDQKFKTASIPFYALMDPDQNVIATFPQLTRDAREFLAFLETRPARAA